MTDLLHPTREYRVTPVTRYLVTRYDPVTTKDGGTTFSGGSRVVGEFPNGQIADEVAGGLAASDTAKGIEAHRTRHGLSLGEVLSGQRVDAGEQP